MKSDIAISVKNLKKSYKKLKVLKGIDFEVKQGSVLALLGPNGAGKTTTIKILSTLLLPDSGKAVVNGFNVVEEPDKVKSTIGLTGQFSAVDEYLTGEENLLMIGRLYRLGRDETKNNAKRLIKQFDLEKAANRRVKTYSGGMKRRLDLAMSLIASPSIIFLDEPTTGLDPRSRMVMWDIIERMVKEGTTVLLTTQYMEEADRLANKVVVIDNGMVIAEGTPDSLKTKVGSDRLEVTIAKKNDFETAKKAIHGRTVQLDPERGAISIATRKGVSDLKNVLQKLEDSGVQVDTVSLHRPTLDDVFIALTGHEASVERKAKNGKNK